MPRRHQNVDFLRNLKSLSGHAKATAFAKACGKSPDNMHNYLQGTPVPQKRFLISCLENLFDWSLKPIQEIASIPSNLNSLPSSSGIYVIYDSGAQVLYIGKATNFRQEVRQALGRKIPIGIRVGPRLGVQTPKMRELAHYLSLYEVPSPRVRHNMEALLLRIFANQTHNSNKGNFIR